MSKNNDIRFLQRHEIDDKKWNELVERSPGGWLYARSFYLDGMGNWAGLVLNDYEFIMPLPWRKKYGIQYIYIPAFTGQLGIIGPDNISPRLIKQFIESIPSYFRLCDLMMNETNPLIALPNHQVVQRTNYVIDLSPGYLSISNGFNKDAKKNLRRAAAENLHISDSVPIHDLILLYKKAYGSKNRNISGSDYRKFEDLAQNCIRLGFGMIIGVRNAENELLAAAFFGKDEKRVYYILGAPTEYGRKLGAVHWMINEVIRRFSGTRLLFDFEGSDILSVSRFYLKFGPAANHYPFIKICRLPKWVYKIMTIRRNLQENRIATNIHLKK